MYTRRVHLCVHLPKRHLVTVRCVFLFNSGAQTSEVGNFQPLTLGSSQLPTSFSSIFLVTIVTKVRPNPLNDWLSQKERRWQPRWLSKKLKDFHLKALWAATPKWDARCSNSSVRGPGRSYLIRNDRKMWTRGIKRSISTQLNKHIEKSAWFFLTWQLIC